jgi:hypothetical protein
MSEVTFEAPQGLLPAGVTLRGRSWIGYGGQQSVELIYRGTKEALIAIGCLTPSMIEMLSSTAHSKHDEKGGWFGLHRSPTKGVPDRMKLCRHASAADALDLPGMRELFPQVIAMPRYEPHRPADKSAVTARDWKRGVTVTAEQMVGAVKDAFHHALDSGGTGRFRFAYSDLGRVAAILNRCSEEMSAALDQAEVIDTEAASARPAFLRLVVDNTSEVIHG